VRTHQLNIANGAFHAGTPITADASADDRLLLAYTLGDHARRRLLAATLRHLATGRRRTLTAAPFLVTDQLLLNTDPVLPIDIDGELQITTPVDIRVDPNALRVIWSRKTSPTTDRARPAGVQRQYTGTTARSTTSRSRCFWPTTPRWAGVDRPGVVPAAVLELIVVGMAVTWFSITDPADPGMLDVVGFDAALPLLTTEYPRFHRCVAALVAESGR
jgi:hypothetical protein